MERRPGAAVRHPDVDRDLVPYGERLEPGDYAPIPERDLPAGLPAWLDAFAGLGRPQGPHRHPEAGHHRGHRSPDARPWD
jgi:hypothetical protein